MQAGTAGDTGLGAAGGTGSSTASGTGLPVAPDASRGIGIEPMSESRAEEALWRDYRAQLFGFVLRRVSDAAAAEDIVHDVLVRAWSKRDTLRNAGRFEPWLFQITRNALIDHYRSRRPSEPLPDDLADPHGLPDRPAMQELAKCMQPLVDTLPHHYRDALSLSELQGLTQQETAARLGLSLSGAKSRVQRARRLLEAKLLECCRIEVDSRGTIVDYEQANGCAPAGQGIGCDRC
jgi:RNA polymerase sigma-70 factor, ECF subfamily